MAGLEAKLGDPQRAAEMNDKVVKARTRLIGPDAAGTLTARYGYWDSLRIAKRFDDAAAGLSGLLADISRALGDKHWLATQTRATLARTLFDGGHAAEALPYAREAAAQFEALYGPDHARTRNTTVLRDQIVSRLGSAGPGK